MPHQSQRRHSHKENKAKKGKSKSKENNRGKEAENKVEEAIRILISENSLFIGYHRAVKNKEIDQLGIDFIIFLSNLIAIPLQVKKGAKGLERHYRRHPHILAIAVGEKAPEELACLIKKLVAKLLKKIATDPFKPVSPHSLE